MKTAGIIAEYNPFHEGHRYHIEETRRLTGADYIVVVMSGDFVQRGEPAIVDKYLRAQMALESGADLILEMPALYATSSAEYFATAGVGTLSALSCVDYLSFGSEKASVEELTTLADLMLEEPDLYKETLKRELESGRNYPQAREEAVYACLPREEYREILRMPNHILALEYIKAIRRRDLSIQPVAVFRKGSGYLMEEWDMSRDIYPSATALRLCLREMKNRDLLEKGSPLCSDLLWECMERRETVDWEDLMPYLDYKVLMDSRVLGKYFGMDYDIFRRITKRYTPGKKFEDIISICHSRNYTDAALRRILLHVLLDMEDYPFMRQATGIPIPYIRILGLRKEAGKLLSVIRERADIPVIQKTVEGRSIDRYDQSSRILFDHDMRCAAFYEQIAARKAGREARNEWQRNPVIL
ncbi:MAG: nucleotidyltransferase family protein [Eubacterium sp.]|nr:nucleotidyltransferase family protein [Eubacterium sp.]